MRRFIAFAVVLLVVASARTQEKKDEFPPIPAADLKLKEPVEYNKDILPIFEAKCFVCHSGSVTEGKFDMGAHDKVLKGGKRGAAVVPGKSAESNLFLFCARQKKPIMPPKSEEPLEPKEVALIKAWIDEGAKAPTTARVKEKVVVNLPPALVKPVRAVAVAPGGKLIAASRGNQVHIFEVRTVPADTKGGPEKKEWEYARSLFDPQLKTPDGKPAKAAHISLVESMAFSPDGNTLLTGSFQELTVWSVARRTARVPVPFFGHNLRPLTVWNADKIEPVRRIGGFADRVCAIAFSPDGKTFATGGGAPTEDGEIKVFDAETGKLLAEIRAGHSDTVFGVAFSPDGKLLATCGADKFVKVWELPAGADKPAKLVKSFEGHTNHVMGIGWTPDGKKLASCGADNLVKVWDYEKGEKIRDMQGHAKQVTALAFVGKTAQFVTGSGDASVRMWNAENGGTVRSFPGAADFVYAVGASPDGAVIVSGCEDGVVRVYNGTNGTLLKAALPPDAEPKKDAPKKN
jgi:WD40 repeat protein